MSARRRSSRRHSRPASAARGGARIVRGGVCPLPQACVELLERRLAGTQLLFVERVQGCVHRAQVGMQVFRLLLDVKQAGNDLSLGGVVLPKSERGGAVAPLASRT